MAESVDALVSNTSGATHPGSIPGLGTEAGKVEKLSPISFLSVLLWPDLLLNRLYFANIVLTLVSLIFIHESNSALF